MQDGKCCTFCSAKALSNWKQFLGAVILNNLNSKNHCPALHTHTCEGLYLAVMFCYSCLLYITWNCLQICCWPYLIHSYICYFWLIFISASKILLSIWLNYWVCDLRERSLDPWGITCFPQAGNSSKNTTSEILQLSGLLKVQVAAWKCCILSFFLFSWVLIVTLLPLLQEVHLLSGRKPSKIMLHGTAAVWPNREVSR